jgi:hypothetical protein
MRTGYTVRQLCELRAMLEKAIQLESSAEHAREYRLAYDIVMDELEPAIFEFWNERAAVFEIDGKLSRQCAEERALRETCQRFGLRDKAYDSNLNAGMKRLDALIEQVSQEPSAISVELDRLFSLQTLI